MKIPRFRWCFVLTGSLLFMGYTSWLSLNETIPVKRGPILQVVHLDLRGIPLKMSYLMDLVPRLARVGVTGLLVEYANMFPYKGLLKNISSRWPYSETKILEFLNHCAQQQIEVIPVIQTSSQMEHVLQKRAFPHLREREDLPNVVNLSDPRSLDLAKEMLRQVMALHNNSKWIQVGCYENEHPNTYANPCSRCTMKNETSGDVLIKYVTAIATFVREHSNNTITPVIWDDWISWMPDEMIVKSNLHRMVEIAISYYDFDEDINIKNVYNIFPRIWLAGAFKGQFWLNWNELFWDDPSLMLPSISSSHSNHKFWMRFIEKNAKTLNSTIVGFISTGSSTDDRSIDLFKELFPVTIPSLILTSLESAATLSPSRDVVSEYHRNLECPYGLYDMLFGTIKDIYILANIYKCKFKESRVVAAIWEFNSLTTQIKKLHDNVQDASEQRYLRHDSKNKRRHADVIDASSLYVTFNFISERFFVVYGILKSELPQYFHNDVAEQSIEPFLNHFEHKLKDISRWYLYDIASEAQKQHLAQQANSSSVNLNWFYQTGSRIWKMISQVSIRFRVNEERFDYLFPVK